MIRQPAQPLYTRSDRESAPISMCVARLLACRRRRCVLRSLIAIAWELPQYRLPWGCLLLLPLFPRSSVLLVCLCRRPYAAHFCCTYLRYANTNSVCRRCVAPPRTLAILTYVYLCRFHVRIHAVDPSTEQHRSIM